MKAAAALDSASGLLALVYQIMIEKREVSLRESGRIGVSCMSSFAFVTDRGTVN